MGTGGPLRCKKRSYVCAETEGSVDLGDDLVQSTAQEGSHGHRTQCLPPLATEASLQKGITIPCLSCKGSPVYRCVA